LAYTSYQTTPYCSPSTKIWEPVDAAEVKTMVLEAIALNMTMKALGSRHSINDIICTDGIPISMEKLDDTVINEEDETVTVGAGKKMKDVMEFLQQNNRSFIHLPAYSKCVIRD
jgi:FAD/FMN-containing dehydrogenase